MVASPIGLVVVLGLFVIPILGGISPPSPIIYHAEGNITRMLNYGTGSNGWRNLENVSFVSANYIGGSMIVNNSKLYTYGIAALAGIGVNSTAELPPTFAKDFYPETIVNVRSTYTSGLVLLSNGSTYSWGTGNLTRYGINSVTGPFLGQPFDATLGAYPLESLTIKPTAPHPPFKAIYSGVSFAWFGIGYDNQLYTFGLNIDRIVSNGSASDVIEVPSINLLTSPNEVNSIRYIGGQFRSIAFLDDGSWLCWGAGTSVNACGQQSGGFISGSNPTRFYNPYPNITFTKMTSSHARATYALANDSTLWAWGSMYLSGATTSPYCTGSWCSIHQVPAPPGRENVKIIDIWASFYDFFILNEIGEVFDTGTPGHRNYTYSFLPWTFDIPNGHQLDFSKSDCMTQQIATLCHLMSLKHEERQIFLNLVE